MKTFLVEFRMMITGRWLYLDEFVDTDSGLVHRAKLHSVDKCNDILGWDMYRIREATHR